MVCEGINLVKSSTYCDQIMWDLLCIGFFFTGYSNETLETPQYAHVEKENQMSFKGLDDCREISVEIGNSSTTNNLYANGTRHDNIYQNTELKDTANLYSSKEANNTFSEYKIAVSNLPSIARIKRNKDAFKKEYSVRQ